MDIELLSKMVKELILDNDRVSLPGVGAFVAEMVPSSFSDRGYTINPPYRRLAFRQGRDLDTDTLLVDFYAAANKVDASIAKMVVGEFVSGMAAELRQRKTIVFPGLGRLRATKENIFFFIPDENLDIFPEGFGLEPISLKSHSKPTSFDFTEIDEAMPSKGSETVAEAAPEAEVAPVINVAPVIDTAPIVETPKDEEQVAEAVSEPSPVAPAPKKSLWRRPWFVVLFVLICITALAAVLYGAFMLLSVYCPDFIDSLLYSTEELDIIYHYKNS